MIDSLADTINNPYMWAQSRKTVTLDALFGKLKGKRSPTLYDAVRDRFT